MYLRSVPFKNDPYIGRWLTVPVPWYSFETFNEVTPASECRLPSITMLEVVAASPSQTTPSEKTVGTPLTVQLWVFPPNDVFPAGIRKLTTFA